MNHEYKCPCCGGAITFDSDIQKMKCPYCDTEFDVQAFTEHEDISGEAEELNWEKSAGREWDPGETDGMTEYACNSCGGTIICDYTTAATKCPYCGNPVVMMGNVSGVLKPDLIIPFKKSKEDAKQAYFNHLKGKKLLPDTFRDKNHIDEIKGVYVPFWLFDSDTKAHLRFKATRVRHWTSGDYYYTETSYFSVIRGGNVGFELIPVDGSSAIPDDIMESIEPFDISEADSFHTAYFAGYMADKYDVDSESSKERANTRIRNSTTALFRGEVRGYNTVNVEHSTIRLFNSNVQYAMYPVWILNTTWEGKNYLFAMNGQTGKFVGDLPMDKKKYWTRFFIYLVIFTALILEAVFYFSA